MNLLEFIRLIARNWKVLVLFPLTTAGIVFFLTRNTKKEYVSNTQVYTGIASGYGITSGENDRVDYFAVNNAFDNLMATIKSRETIEEVGMRLLAKHLLVEKPSYKELSDENFNHIKELIPEKLRKQLVAKGSEELTFFRIESYKKSKEVNEIVSILSSPGSIYGLEVISANMNAQRKQSSDMIEISYKSNDPAVCQQTLQYIVDVVMIRYKGIKGTETNNVVKDFEEQLRLAAQRLRKSEDKLRDYSSEKKIINYYEQAKFVAESKENVTADRQKQEMALEASKAALKKVEEKIEMKKNIIEVNSKLSKMREQLAEVTYKIANAELYEGNKTLVSQYKSEAEKIKKQIKEEVESQYKWNNTPEGLPRANILSEWLTNYLAVEENEARLKVILHRLDGFDAIYKELAPVGSNLKRIEREVDVNEKEYLSVLHGLNMARLRQQSLEMSNNLSITDYPFLPLKPQPSKRTIFIIMAFMATFILTLAIVLGKSLLGRTIQSPARAEKYTGLQFFSAFPNYLTLDKKVIIEHLDDAILSHFISNMRIHLKSNGNDKTPPLLLTISSIKKGEGKSFCGKLLAEKLKNVYDDILYLSPDELSGDNLPGITFQRYSGYNKMGEINNAKEWIASLVPSYSKYKVIIIELVELSKFSIPDKVLNGISLNLFILSSERVWSEADSRALGVFTKMTTTKPMVILNNTDIDRLETIVGEIPKRRSNVRKVAKRIVTFDFQRT
ncbi:MAG: hypothetical protein IPP46_16220 [Bacteroidetes bacterium]|nr:hypothetical protein [Bacteroidota bacterium]